jgi:prolyl oligopeptidase
MHTTGGFRKGSRWAGLALALPAAAVLGERIAYPPAPRGAVVDDYHGSQVADPYRWLEEDSPRRAAWLDGEERLTAERLARLPARETIRARLAALSSASSTEVPRREGESLFFAAQAGEAQQAAFYVSDLAGSKPRVVVDPSRISPDGSLAVRDFLVSPGGRRVAFSEARGGEDVAELRVWDVSSARDLGDSVPGVGNMGTWTLDAAGFFYVRHSPAKPDGARAGRQILYHRVGGPAAADPLIHEFPGEEARWAYTKTSEDGRYALLVAEKGSETELVAMNLGDPLHPDLRAPRFRLLGAQRAFHTPIDFAGDTLYLRTDLDAPRGRIVALDLKEGAAAIPRPLVAESMEVIEDAILAGGKLVVHTLADVQSHLRVYTLDSGSRGEIPLPGIGAVGWPLSGRPSAPDVYYSFASFLEPSTIYVHDLATAESRAFRPPEVRFDAGRYETRQTFIRAKDGARVPVFVVAAKGLRLDGSHPAFLTAYGGYGASLLPAYEPDIPLWLEMGGVYAVANLRGGGEYGEAWHRAGMLEKKQTSFDDFYAAAESLISAGYTSPERLAIYGHSNGGLLIGAAITQRPELFAAAVANAGHYDMLRYPRFTAGSGWVSEYGSPDDPEAFRYLRAYSPLHNVAPGTCYPSTLLLAADHDDRVVPSHSYKFAAALQAAQGCGRPILLRVARDASHSYASREAQLQERADMWAFIAAQTAAR